MSWLLLGAALAQGLDVNGASLDALGQLPGVGPVKARALAEWREVHGPCRDLAELETVPGFGPGTVRGLVGRAHCGEGVPEPLEVAVHPVPPALSLHTVDLNRASVDELLLLPAMSRGRAERLVSDREREGDYATCRDATRVPGIGPATVAAWGARCEAR